jgi:hypothetical protein
MLKNIPQQIIITVKLVLKTIENGFFTSLAKRYEKHIVIKIGTPKATGAIIAPGE